MRMDVLYIVAPAYNEEANIEEFVREWHPIASGVSPSSRLLVIDDGSTDATPELLERLKKDHPQLDTIAQRNMGHGPTVLLGYRTAIDRGATWVFQTDSDRQTLPTEFDGFWRRRAHVDAVFGVRSRRQDGISRKWMERVMCAMLRHCFGVKIPDANAPFRLMRADVLTRHLELVPCDFGLPNAVLTALFAQDERRVLFEPITFLRRPTGRSTLRARDIVRMGLAAFNDFRFVAKQASQRVL